MGALRPHEALVVLRALEELASADPLGVRGVLATLVTVDGALHERSGAIELFCDDAASGAQDARPVGTLPERLRTAFDLAISERTPRIVEVDIDGDEALFGPGGLSGSVELWLEPVTGELRESLREAREMILRGRGLIVELVLSGDRVGHRAHYDQDHPGVRDCYAEGVPELDEEVGRGGISRVLQLPLIPMGHALLIGSGADARRLARLLDRLGFVVTVADHRPGRLHGERWDRVRWRLVEGAWDVVRAAVRPDADTFIVVMSHNHDADLLALKGALQSPASYVGFVASSARAKKILAELDGQGVEPRPGVFSAPAGLDAGAETPEEIALCVAAEILAVRMGRKGGRPARLRPAGSAPAARRGGIKVPGLVLAAGRGRRFGGTSKLLAKVDGRPVLRHVVEAALASRLDPVIVVLGAGAESGLQAIKGLEDARLRIVFNPAWESGKASSFQVALREVPDDAPGVVALLGDMPRIKPWLIDRVLSEFEISGRLCFPIYPGDEGPQKGQPTAYPRELFGEVGHLIGDETAMAAVRRHWGEAVKIPLDDASSQVDIDTAQDLELLSVSPESS